MSKMLEIEENPGRETISVNILKSQVEYLKRLKKEKNISISRIVERALTNSFPESSNN